MSTAFFNEDHFGRFRRGRTNAPVWAVTPPSEKHIHTFFDVCPWSPDARYLLTIKFPFDDREPTSEDKAEICITDLSNGTIRTIAKTGGWALQMGAHQQWGAEGHLVYFNDLSDGRVICREVDIDSGTQRELNGPLYQVSPDNNCILGPSLERINFAQGGYGVPFSNPEYVLQSDEKRHDGLWRTDVRSGKCEMLISTYEMCRAVGLESDRQDTWTVLFHTKFNTSGDRVMQVVRRMRWNKGPCWERFIVTLRPDGTDVRLALSPESWRVPGHHPHWHPDNKNITMNLTDSADQMRFCQFCYDGTGFAILHKDIPGGGHPSYSKDSRLLLTDAYVEEPISLKNDEVPIRLISGSACERTVCYVPVTPDIRQTPVDAGTESIPEFIDSVSAKNVSKLVNRQSLLDVYRIDPHPVWSRDCSMVCFNAAHKGSRSVFIADVSTISYE